MCSRMPVHIPGHCPVLPPVGEMLKRLEDFRTELVRRRYPPGPWPFQQAQRTREGSR